MMSINLTIIAQAVHFFIAYFLIKKLFFKPIMHIINKEIASELELQRKKVSVEERLVAAEKTKNLFWQKTQSILSTIIPKKQLNLKLIKKIQQEKITDFAPSDIHSQANKLAEHLTEKMRYVR